MRSLRTLTVAPLLASLILCGALAVGSSASAATPAPGWQVTSRVLPSHIEPGGAGLIFLNVLNVGAANSSGTVTVTDVLPPGLVATDAGASLQEGGEPNIRPTHNPELWDCSGTQTVTCVNDPSNLPSLTGGAGVPVYSPSRGRFDPKIGIEVEAAPAAEGSLLNHVTVSGGGAPGAATTSEPLVISPDPAPFGLSSFDAAFSNADGTTDTQAGSHPYSATFSLAFNTVGRTDGPELSEEIRVPEQARDVEIELPPGLIGDPTAVPQCPRELFENDGVQPGCPPDTQIGVVNFNSALSVEPDEPVFNLVPPPGKPAEFGFNIVGNTTYLDSAPRTGGDNGITTSARNIAQKNIQSSIVSLWGFPADPSHAQWLADCQSEEPCTGHGSETVPFLTLPTACAGPQRFTARTRPYFNESEVVEASVVSHDSKGNPRGFEGCERLSFGPTTKLAPEKSEADAPTALSAEVTPPLGGLLSNSGLSSAAIEDATVTLPKGLTINPGQAAGLTACGPAESAVGTEAAPSCLASSRVGSVSIDTPLLPDRLEGSIYVLPSNPPEVKLLVAASADGVNEKLVGTAHLDPLTGQLTTRFESTPQLPFSSFKLNFAGAPRAALVTPPRCGSYESSATFNSWGSPFLAAFAGGSAFSILSGTGGAPCPPTPLPFSPAMQAGTTNPVAGASSSFALKVSKPDDQQNIASISATLPPGQLAKLSGVPLCPEADTTSGNCPAASQVGSVGAAVGPGANPLVVPQPGKAPTAAYLAGPYKGAPYSLVVKVPAQAGPFDLGTVVVRTALEVNETTTQVTAKSDPLPQILDGVPLDYQSLTVSIDRPGFIQNPTNCEPMKVGGTISGSEGAGAAVSSRYQVGDCASLGFKPSLKLSLKGATKRSGVPALKAVLTYPKGNYANVKSVSTVLPKSEFIDNAHIGNTCTRVQFAAGAGQGAECPANSLLGHAIAYSPLLEKPLEGNVYLRSNGGERELPDIVAALKGQIPVTLVGFIDSVGKKGTEISRLRTRFMNVPDAPVSRFVLQLAGAKHGLLENSANLCKVKNIAQVKAVAQNGKTYDTTPAVANDCGKKGKRQK
jgi:hypothetical protein